MKLNSISKQSPFTVLDIESKASYLLLDINTNLHPPARAFFFLFIFLNYCLLFSLKLGLCSLGWPQKWDFCLSLQSSGITSGHTTVLCPRTLKTFLKLYLFILMDVAYVCMSEDNLCKFLFLSYG